MQTGAVWWGGSNSAPMGAELQVVTYVCIFHALYVPWAEPEQCWSQLLLVAQPGALPCWWQWVGLTKGTTTGVKKALDLCCSSGNPRNVLRAPSLLIPGDSYCVFYCLLALSWPTYTKKVQGGAESPELVLVRPAQDPQDRATSAILGQ